MYRKVRCVSYIAGLMMTLSRGAHGQGIDTIGIRQAFRDFDAACALAAARAWSRELCGPILLVDRSTRAAIANRRDPDGAFAQQGALFIGRAPANAPFANTAFRWRDQRWAVVMLPLPELRWNALALLAHESTHRLQDSLEWRGQDVANAHLDMELGRLWWRVELRALQHALTTTGAAQRVHATAAMQFRRERARLFPGSAAAEDALEYAEGTAEYLGQQVAHSMTPIGPLATVNAMRSVEASPTLVRSAAYATGPALGLLLDAISPRWHAQLRKTQSMATQLVNAVGVGSTPLSADSIKSLAAPYGYAHIAREERDRAARQKETRERLIALLATGPTVTLHQSSAYKSFDPNTLIPLDSLGTAYPTGTFDAEWGKLEVASGGALLSSDGMILRVAALGSFADGAVGVVRGDGWVLSLKPGFVLRAGERAGDFVVRRVGQD